MEVARTASDASRSRELGFDSIDIDDDGMIDQEELSKAVERCLGTRVSSRIVLEQMMNLMDEDRDGHISREELKDGMAKLSQRGSMSKVRCALELESRALTPACG